jgi:hypothetical protein
MIMFLAELNGIQCWNTDIGNTQEKICIVAGKEFACVIGLKGHTLLSIELSMVSNQAVYVGMNSSQTSWRQMGFFPSKANHDIWMKACDDHSNYIVAYLDDLLVASKDPSVYIKEFQESFTFKLKAGYWTSFLSSCCGLLVPR